MDLTTWILERVAEDEAPTFEVLPYECPPGCCAPAGWVGHRCLICQDATSYGGTVEAITEICREHEEKIHQRTRVLAQCESVKAIVELHQNVSGRCASCAHEFSWRVFPCPTLLALASIWQDHPSFAPEWRAEVGA